MNGRGICLVRNTIANTIQLNDGTSGQGSEVGLSSTRQVIKGKIYIALTSTFK